MSIPDDFGGLVAFWAPDTPYAFIARTGHGEVQEHLRLTPLNLLQLRKIADVLIEEGKKKGVLTPEHEAQAEQLPSAHPDTVMPRDQVDTIAGED